MGMYVETTTKGQMVLKNVKNFNLDQIADSGQCFRWRKIEQNKLEYGDMGYLIPAHSSLLRIEQQGSTLWLWCTEEEFYKYWLDYFDLNTDYSKFIEAVKGDKFLEKAAEYGSGIRILRQEPFETLISFMLSSANNIPRIKSLVEKICDTYGTKVTFIKNPDESWANFPVPAQLHRAKLDELKALGMGFRANNIYNFMVDLYSVPETYEENERVYSLNYILNHPHLTGKETEKLHKLLTTINGIGDKIASCIELFAYHQLDAFPIDVWIDRILFTEYGGGVYPYPERKKTKYRNMILDKHFSKYTGFRGVIQQYMYYYYREGKKE